MGSDDIPFASFVLSERPGVGGRKKIKKSRTTIGPEGLPAFRQQKFPSIQKAYPKNNTDTTPAIYIEKPGTDEVKRVRKKIFHLSLFYAMLVRMAGPSKTQQTCLPPPNKGRPSP